MSYQATVINVIIASPSDVESERELTRAAVHEWNVVRSAADKLVLLPIGWETHASPQLGDRPQEIINNQIVHDVDLLIAIFWTRLGSPTGRAASGTVEEINEHLSRGRPALLYFSNKPKKPSDVETEQYQALIEFKTKMKANGLISEFETEKEFQDNLRRQLHQTVIRNFAGDDVKMQRRQQSVLAGNIVVPNLSASAKELLTEVAKDQYGTAAWHEIVGGCHLQTNDREFINGSDPRLKAKWRAAVDNLLDQKLISDVSGEGEIFEITQVGYLVADLLAENGHR